jgi:hypothetical protein
MNIEGSKLASVLQPGIAVEGSGQALIDNGPSAGGFADALMGQLASLGEAKVKGTLPAGPQVTPAEPQQAGQPFRLAEFSGMPGDRQYEASTMPMPPLPESTDKTLTQPEAVESRWPANAAFQKSQASAPQTAGETDRRPAGPAADTKAALEAVTDSLNYRATGNTENASPPPAEYPIERYSGERQYIAEHSVKLPAASEATVLRTDEASKGDASEALPAVVVLTPSLRHSHSDSEKTSSVRPTDTKSAADDSSDQEIPLVAAIALRPQTVEAASERQDIRPDEGQEFEGSAREDSPDPEFSSIPPQNPFQAGKVGLASAESGENVDHKSNEKAVLSEAIEPPRQKIDQAGSTVREESAKKKNPDLDKDTADPAPLIPSLAALASTPIPPQPAPPPLGTEKGFDDVANEEAAHKISPQPFIKPLFEEVKSNGAAVTAAPEDDTKQAGGFGQIIKEFQFPNVGSTEKSPPPKDASSNEAGLSVPDAANGPPRGMAELVQANRQPFENRADIPAMTKPLLHPDWNKDLGERILWMNSKELSAAEIRLNPEHLGPISVRIEMRNDQATIAFTAQHAAVRDVLEASLPKLREMMSDQQFNLADVNISQNASSGQHQQQQQSSFQQSPKHFEAGVQRTGSMAEAAEEPENGSVTVNKGLLNIYA